MPADKLRELALGLSLKLPLDVAPEITHETGVQRLVRQNQSPALLLRKPALGEIQVKVLVAAVEFVADDRMARMRQVDSYLVLAPGARRHQQQRKLSLRTRESALHAELRLRRRAVRAHAVFDRHATFLVPAQGRVDDTM